MRAQVIRSHQRELHCKTESGEDVVAWAKAGLLKNDEIVVGDWVQLEKTETDDYAIIEVEERSASLFRYIVREQKKKVTAANCEIMVILSSVSKPSYKQGIVDRFLVRAQQWGVRPIIVFNKMDEHKPQKVDLCFERDRVKDLSVECYEVSAKFPKDYQLKYFEKGLDELISDLKGKLCIFLGQSGVGKSRTINTLTDGRLKLKTNEIGKSGKGSHTTTWSEIVEANGFRIIDSPGIRSFSLEDLYADELMSFFPDLEPLALRCKFTNCQHKPDSKSCAFESHYHGCSREDQLIISRLESYLKLLNEVSGTPDWKK